MHIHVDASFVILPQQEVTSFNFFLNCNTGSTHICILLYSGLRMDYALYMIIVVLIFLDIFIHLCSLHLDKVSPGSAAHVVHQFIEAPVNDEGFSVQSLPLLSLSESSV